MSYAVTVATLSDDAGDLPAVPDEYRATVARTQSVRDTVTGKVSSWDVYDRAALRPGAQFAGPAIVAEDETSTLVPPGWSGNIDARGYIALQRESAS